MMPLKVTSYSYIQYILHFVLSLFHQLQLELLAL